MTQTLAELFPKIETETWQAEREECWQLALAKGEWKSEYRKKDLEKIRHYFFTGQVVEGLPILKYSGSMLMLSPIQTKAGYDYYYQTHEFTEDQVKSNISSAFHDQETHGMRWQEQRSYFDYHVGQVFMPEIIIMVLGEEITITIDALSSFESIVADFSLFLRKGIGDPDEKILYFVPYFESLIDYLVNNEIQLSTLQDPIHPNLIKRVKGGEFRSKNEEQIPYQKQLIEDLLPIVERIENSLK